MKEPIMLVLCAVDIFQKEREHNEPSYDAAPES